MASLNKVFLMGNLTRDPELRYTPAGAAVATFGLAVNRKYKQGDTVKDETCFVEITVWGKQGENCAEYLAKGRGVLVEGRLHFSQWETDEGQKRSKLDVVATGIQFLSSKPKGESSSSSPSHGHEEGDAGLEDNIPF